ncbi:ABC-2 type transport system permease protein [Desulfonispora thiosulfatigenes DSM 11270]|uniref:ABC-2 type transport system permease protein n=1 Tax=Desulfonispora thiosulfatigenes DSM 11270 TaxID=656914 RepID=A0A1W1UVC3_DESTI|nr:ABC transporter permease [Desulfonispora thiosulfatigenes]SMB85033.1 ABC-2 type transport system permease protein [Desulfonispora thiosulfatigenes DSM 11270]
MRDFWIVLKFELMGFMKNKSFIIPTIILCLLLAIGLSVPTIQDAFFSSDSSDGINGDTDNVSEDTGDRLYGYVDEKEQISNITKLQDSFLAGTLVKANTSKELEEKVTSEEFTAGYIIKSPTNYEYVIKNNQMMDLDQINFEDALTEVYRTAELEKRGIEYTEIEGIIYPQIEADTKVLGKDSEKNFVYTYILIFGLYFMIILYGQLIATSVASEKSNRTMEVLITSTKSSNLMFGKVIGGALAGIIQFALIILTGIIAYHLNKGAWNNSLDFIFEMPENILLTFFVFGTLGYLIYAFIYGALGALVSRTEDISSSSAPITILFVVVFFIAIVGMQNTEGSLLKVASFIPFSSFMAMFVRISMGTVSNLEIIISLSILILTTGLIGWLAAKIYRMGTLMYGNKVKFKDIIKILKSA